ncbi:MAG: hypothetical protein GF411_17910 [Candidatus Lokiarchaeota archaeon]|nr:hypothetical protein [Candidatus Lokiarchaeota archaeon]
MTDERSELEWHKKMAKSLFNRTWDLIDKGADRTRADNDDMIHSAHASRYHWGVIVESGEEGTGPVNLARGEWQISRVYALLELPKAAMYHANRSLEICEENGIGDFDLSFAYEALARAHSLIDRDADDFKKYFELAKKSAKQIEKEGNKKYLLSELDTI